MKRLSNHCEGLVLQKTYFLLCSVKSLDLCINNTYMRQCGKMLELSVPEDKLISKAISVSSSVK